MPGSPSGRGLRAIADRFGMPAAIWTVAAITSASGLVVLTRMYETHPPESRRPPGEPTPRPAEALDFASGNPTDEGSANLYAIAGNQRMQDRAPPNLYLCWAARSRHDRDLR
jgi:hypothetical protein